jgi:hypothetical protein
LVHDMDSHEAECKARFVAFRTRGEWFEVSDEVLAMWPAYIPKDVSTTPVLRIVPPKPSLEERILTLLLDESALTIRSMQRRLYGVTAGLLKDAIRTLHDTGKLTKQRRGKAVLYGLSEAS